MTLTFRDALMRIVESRPGLSLKIVAEMAGVSYDQVKKLKQRDTASTNVDDAIKIAHALGLTLDEMLDDNLASDRIAIATLYSQLSPELRQLLRALELGLPALPPPEER